MYERAEGYRYAEQRGKSTAEVAKLMRRDIKNAIADGLLPGAPVKYSVRIETYSGGASIDITAKNWPDAWMDCDGFHGHAPRVSGRGRELCRNHFCAAKLEHTGETLPGAERHQKLTEDAEAAKMTLERIHAAYNHNGSDVQSDYFDVNYYGGVTIQTARAAAFDAEQEAKKEARRAKLDELAGVDTVRIKVYGSGGRRHTVHDAAVVNGSYRPVCGAQLWRSSLAAPADGAELTCTRCIKRAERAAASAREDVPAAPRVMHAFEVRTGDRVATTRMSLDPADARAAGVLAAMFAGATHYRAAGAAEWKPIAE